MNELERFTDAIRQLHRQKSTAYGNAWKRRGEQISIMANLARKADRLETIASGSPASHDESTLDTAVDLLVYSLKYLTYLADQDPAVGRSLGLSAIPGQGFSDQTAGFEQLLDRTSLEAAASEQALEAAPAATQVIERFTELEGCFGPEGAAAPATVRTAQVLRLLDASIVLVAALRQQDHHSYQRFLSAWAN
jgi:hypothetical protein